jgi:predicted metal-dependent hydrolase
MILVGRAAAPADCLEDQAGFACDDGRMGERDRDESGRPRSRRPRDSFGRPLPKGSEGSAGIPDNLELPPVETLSYAQDLLNRGLAFNAHEVFEAAWKNGPVEERTLWQGLAQLAVGITHIQRGNLKGAITLLRRASDRLLRYDLPAPHAIDTAGLADFADVLIKYLAGGADITAESLRPRLVMRSDSPRHR